MIKGLKRLAAGGILLRELRSIRQELTQMRSALTRVAEALEAHNAHAFPQQVQMDAAQLPTEVAYISDEQAQELMEIELRLASATGRAPSEEEIVQEYERRHDLEPGSLGGRGLSS